MLLYWLLFLIPAVGVFSPGVLNARSQRYVFWLIGAVFTLAIGLRFQVGGDWGSYLKYLDRGAALTFFEVFEQGDPGYYLVNWLVGSLGGSIYWVNGLCGLVVMAGVIRFALRQPLPWLVLLVAVPYLIMVVAMGYTRQATALGFVLLGLVALGDGKLRGFVVWVLIAAAFHKSAVLMIPVAALASGGNRLWIGFWVGLMTLLGGYLFLFDSADALWTNYVEADYQSSGGFIRVMMNAVPALLFVLLRDRLGLNPAASRLWWWMSVLSIICIPLVLLSSTATDRVALYLIPIQLFVFARLHLISTDLFWRSMIVLGVVAYYALVQFVWLNFATHAYFWLPYQLVWFVE
ncbi:EpsG family protein [Marinobacter sp. M3C]|jgi:hypothetical protein|uniref:EpsG family protein n=1 Tax=unclassified Marinobacter TaxID=83889 RepID=UPI00200DD459|nr:MULTISPECIES: EpsG family protein [unclassified Marinobacter]MCL1479098.1 EpsG family protein [Marinobacter sp.]MCL1488934.1 EpsG family protein [Marinobacter sp.]UQG57174.1 EpsG family protein [Marinobacter sp. M4C]UQG61643.1 EpsG family protein [Marinobacter sp. M3C]UQG65978.1 EpsG family protein [Marinobacter sp. M2C]